MHHAYAVLLVFFVCIAGSDAFSVVTKDDSPSAPRSFAANDGIVDKRLLRSDGPDINKDDGEERAVSIPGLTKLKDLVKKGSSKASKFIEVLKYKFWIGIGKTDDDIYKLWSQQGKSTDDIYKLWLKLGKTDEDIYKLLRGQGKSADKIYNQLLKLGKSDDYIYDFLVKQGESTKTIFQTWENQGKSTTDTLRIWRKLEKNDEDIYQIWLQQGKTADEMNQAWLYVYKRPDDVYRLLKLHHVDPRSSPKVNQYIQYRNSYNDMLGKSNL